MKEMELLCTIFFLISYALLVLLLIVTFLLLKICTGKSIKNPNYPPVKRTVFEQLFYLNKLYDHQTQVAKSQPTFRLLAPGQSEIFTADIRNIEHILKTNFDKYCKGEYNQEVLKDLLGRGIFASDGEQWRQQRKVASFEFSTRVVRDFSCSIFGSNAAKLVRVLQELTVSGQVFDMHDMLMRSTLDSILEIGFGIELNCLEGSNEEGAVFTKAFDDSNELIYWRIIDPFWKLKRVLNIGSEAVLKKNIRIIDSFVYNVISTKRKLLAMQREYCVVREDILSRFLAEKRKNPKVMNDQYLRDIILNFMIAGKDTSANALSWFLYMLCKNPLIQEKVAQEVRDVIGRKENDADIDNFMAAISDADLEQMHYLHAALTETLRLYPIIPLDGVRAKMDDILPDGYKVKKGDGVFYMAYAMGRMTYVWGDDACNFRPERWLNNGVFQPQSHFKFIAFHAGPRMCLGKNFAYRQMKIISIALLHHFRFKLADDKENLTYRTMLTLQVKGGLHLQAVPKTTNTQ
ncbi:cytochrome P450 704C1-like [Durio zibethinus]|uniref:Cytochrome P450 704C1-like n=1 Tax=Durio zibethinus TaxID=66656 RepID=A0A6P6AZX7_DURZI|nr:cytochrome P450 704C1-like [Durio zibethinus]